MYMSDKKNRFLIDECSNIRVCSWYYKLVFKYTKVQWRFWSKHWNLFGFSRENKNNCFVFNFELALKWTAMWRQGAWSVSSVTFALRELLFTWSDRRCVWAELFYFYFFVMHLKLADSCEILKLCLLNVSFSCDFWLNSLSFAYLNRLYINWFALLN